MKPVLVLYATREGQTRRIAERFADVLSMRGTPVKVVMAADEPDLDAGDYAAAVIAGSIHFGKHEKELTELVKRQRNALEKIPTLLLSVSLSAATMIRPTASEKQRAAARREVMKCIESFANTTGLRFGRVEAVAGALPYRQYRFGVRLVMRLISGMAGADTDTSRDHEYTDWPALERLAAEWSAPLAPTLRGRLVQEPLHF